ncbi:hypothetical protein DSM112329_01198 [Paraconexibacter sp. AEG42_29]|uniref:Cupin type-2 domain-containing protein n=1 Tax=Paraconexibacter sp. AEG42_29 TaxID=2997339 RepID=A0AAU7ARP4_9ACTN
MPNEFFVLRPGERVTVVSHTADLLEVEAVLTPGGRLPPKHLHPEQDERFEVLEGTLRVVAGGRTQAFGPGESVDIPRGTPHTMDAGGDAPARVRWQTRPALGTVAWWSAVDAAGRRYGGGQVPLPVLARLVQRHQAVFRLALPGPLQGPVLALLARLPTRRPPAG